MRIHRIGAVCVALAVGAAATAQETSLTRADVAAVKAKLVAVQTAMGADPTGYIKESEDFDLPTDANAAREAGKFWPINSAVSMRFTDRAIKEGVAGAEAATKDFQARYAAAMASGDPNAIMKLTEELTRVTQMATAASMNPAAKERMDARVQFNMNPTTGIDPDAVVFESAGVIALREKSNSGDASGRVLVYLDPVALAKTDTLSKIELRTPDTGVSNRIGVYNVLVTLNGTLADLEAWAKTFDTKAMLAVIDKL